jgi:hypothetical protein
VPLVLTAIVHHPAVTSATAGNEAQNRKATSPINTRLMATTGAADRSAMRSFDPEGCPRGDAFCTQFLT